MSGNKTFGAIKLKKAIVLSQGRKAYRVWMNTAKYWEH